MKVLCNDAFFAGIRVGIQMGNFEIFFEANSVTFFSCFIQNKNKINEVIQLSPLFNEQK